LSRCSGHLLRDTIREANLLLTKGTISMTVRRNLVRGTLILALAGAGLGVTAPMATAAPAVHGATAQQAASIAILSQVNGTLKKWKWYQGGGACSALSVVTYDSSSNLVTVESHAYSSNSARACRARTALSIVTTVGDIPLTRDIPTACGGADPTCSNNPEPGEAGRGRAWDLFQIIPNARVTGVKSHTLAQR
jgi:hypothetical protein